MKFMKGILGAAALASFAALVPNSSAQTLQVLTAGSSAQFGPFAAAAYNLAAAGGATGPAHRGGERDVIASSSARHTGPASFVTGDDGPRPRNVTDGPR